MDGVLDVMGIKEKTSLSTQQELIQKKEQEFKLLGKTKRIPGHTLFSFNTKTGEIKEASYRNTPVKWNPMNNSISPKKEIAIEPHCFYLQALNKKNFIRKIIKLGFAT